MGIQINGNTNNINAGIGSLSIEDIRELDITGIATAANFKTGTSNVHSTGYECTNVNATGVITATSFVGSGANLTNLPAANLTGTLPAISGANLTSLPSQVTINNASGNRVITSDGGTTLNGEDTLRYDGTNFLIGTNTEAPYSNRNLTVAAGGSGSSTVAIEIRSPSNGSGRVIFSDGTSADSSANEGQVIYQQSDHKMLFGVAANYQNMALESTGGTGADLNLIDGNLKFASGHGIDFSADADNSFHNHTLSELLDDYEEGSWQPTWSPASGSIGHQSRHGDYIKIGRVVHCMFAISANGSSSPSGELKVSGLPYSAQLPNAQGLRGGGGVAFAGYHMNANVTKCMAQGTNVHIILSDNSRLQSNSSGIGYGYNAAQLSGFFSYITA